MNRDVLIVDDDTGYRNKLGSCLNELGFRYNPAEDGITAIQELKKKKFPLIITDIIMPLMDGMQLIAHVRQYYPNTAILAITDHNEQYSYSDLIEAGAVDFISKSFSLPELNAKLQRIIRERKLFEQLRHEIDEHKKTEEKLVESYRSMEQQILKVTTELMETESALKVMMKHRDHEQTEFIKNLRLEITKQVAPHFNRLKLGGLPERQMVVLEHIESTLQSVISPHNDSHELLAGYAFTPTQLKVANLIKQKKSTKEIADIMGLSIGTVQTHRENIRKKLRITNHKKNLYQTLLSLN
ncbi:MAG: response regulator [Desulfobulbaceae bacterium]|nr:response regulator [Desulfobulbaceae bacterium]